jgi:hypothetical protein
LFCLSVRIRMSPSDTPTTKTLLVLGTLVLGEKHNF